MLQSLDSSKKNWCSLCHPPFHPGACIFRPKHIIAQQISNILLSGLLLQLVQIKYQSMPQYSIFNPYIDSGRGRIIVGQDLDLSGLCRDWCLTVEKATVIQNSILTIFSFFLSHLQLPCSVTVYWIMEIGLCISNQFPILNFQNGEGVVWRYRKGRDCSTLQPDRTCRTWQLINTRGCGELHPHPCMAISYDYPTLHTNIFYLLARNIEISTLHASGRNIGSIINSW